MKCNTLNPKPMNASIYALCLEEFNKVSTCETAIHIWDSLEVTHEGTNQVKELNQYSYSSI